MSSEPSENLVFADTPAIRQELHLEDPRTVHADPMEDPELTQQADDIVARVLKVDTADSDARHKTAAAIESMGGQLQSEAGRRSQMLKQPLADLMRRSEDGGEVANALVDLKIQVEDLDPGEYDFEAGWFTRLLGRVPGVGTPMKRYFSRYESASTVIDAIIRSLRGGSEQLKRDNITLQEDKKAMRELTHRLSKAIKLGQLIDRKLEDKLATEILAEDPRQRFIQEELLFPLTVGALQVAVTLALALVNQRIVLEKVQVLSNATSKLIAGSAARLKQQGAEIHKQASGTQLNLDDLRQAFSDVRYALDDIATYRQQALPKMAENILEMDRLADESEQTIAKMEHARKAAQDFPIEIVD
jgi:uncharacterized protein YaaN involved in tellurite resistance